MALWSRGADVLAQTRPVHLVQDVIVPGQMASPGPADSPSPLLLHIVTRDPCPASQVSSLSISSRILIGAPATFLRVYLLLVGAAGAPPRACVLSCAWVRAWRRPVCVRGCVSCGTMRACCERACACACSLL